MVLMEEEAEWMGGFASVATSHSGKRKSRPKKAGATDHSRRVLMSGLKVRPPKQIHTENDPDKPIQFGEFENWCGVRASFAVIRTATNSSLAGSIARSAGWKFKKLYERTGESLA
jgi:hypothetical protein